jgi:hypothetical protein
MALGAVCYSSDPEQPGFSLKSLCLIPTNSLSLLYYFQDILHPLFLYAYYGSWIHL